VHELNLYKILETRSLQRPNDPALYFSGQKFTYAEIFLLCRQIASTLKLAGIKKQSLVFLDLANPFLNWMCFLALLQEGCISCSIPIGVAIPEKMEIDYFITDNPKNSQTKSAREIIVDAKWISDLQTVSVEHTPDQYPSENDICRLIFTSGSTGDAKLVALNLKTLVHRCYAINTIDPQLGCELILSDVSNSIGLYKAIRGILTGLPISFATNHAQIQRDVVQIPLAQITGSPLQLSSLADFFKTNEFNSVSHVKKVFSAGSKLGINAVLHINKYIAEDINSIYGSTEAGPVAIYSKNELMKKYESSALPFEFIQLEIAGTDLIASQPQKEGMVRVKSPMMFTAYYKNRASLVNTFSDDGWFYPGDTAYLTDQKYLVLCGRLDDVINFGGVKINLQSIDYILLLQPGIKEAVTFAIEDKDGLPKIYCAIVSGPQFNADGINSLLSTHFGMNFNIKLVPVENIPKTHTGKSMRLAVKNSVLAQLVL